MATKKALDACLNSPVRVNANVPACVFGKMTVIIATTKSYDIRLAWDHPFPRTSPFKLSCNERVNRRRKDSEGEKLNWTTLDKTPRNS